MHQVCGHIESVSESELEELQLEEHYSISYKYHDSQNDFFPQQIKALNTTVLFDKLLP